MTLSTKTRLFLILFSAGFIGVLSFLLIDLSAIVSLIPARPGTEFPTITPAIKLLSLVQPTILLALAVFAGVSLAPKVGLSAPFAEALAQKVKATALKRQIVPGLIGGILGAAAIISISLVSRPFMLPEMIERSRRFGELVPIPTRLLYGGITEELLLRWGFMTVIVWLLWRVLQRRRPTPTLGSFIAAIVFSAFVFGVGHLPVAFLLFPDPGLAVVLFVILANSAFGLVAGYLYWKRGLESAMIAHMFAHVILLMATWAGV